MQKNSNHIAEIQLSEKSLRECKSEKDQEILVKHIFKGMCVIKYAGDALSFIWAGSFVSLLVFAFVAVVYSYQRINSQDLIFSGVELIVAFGLFLVSVYFYYSSKKILGQTIDTCYFIIRPLCVISKENVKFMGGPSVLCYANLD